MIAAILVMALGAVLLGAALGYAAIKFKVEGDPLVEKIDAILPQTQCGQCGYPGCKPYAEAIAKGDAEINCCPPGGEEGIQQARRPARPRIQGTVGRARHRKTQKRRLHRRTDLHRLHLVHPGLPGRCHRRCGQANAHHHRQPMHGLRTVPAALPGELHHDGTDRRKRRNLEVEVSGVSAAPCCGQPTDAARTFQLPRRRQAGLQQGSLERPADRRCLCAGAARRTGDSAAPEHRRRTAPARQGGRPRTEGPADRRTRRQRHLVCPCHHLRPRQGARATPDATHLGARSPVRHPRTGWQG